MTSGQASRFAALRAFFARSDDPYAGADREMAVRIGGLVWLLGAAIAGVLLPLSPPDEAIGDAGWAVAGVAVALAFASGYIQRMRPARITHDHLLIGAYGGLATIAVMEWLAGGHDSPYDQLFLLAVVYTACVHPPRRFGTYMIVAALAIAAPLAYEGWSNPVAGEIGTQLLIWTGIGMLGTILMTGVRRQRLSLHREGEHAKRLARVDALTGLGNRRAFDEALDSAIARSRRSGEVLSVAVLDVDDFKQINDRFGHMKGDQCLRQVAAVIRDVVRRPDAAFRWGGDEFAVLLEDTGHEEALNVGARVAGAVESQCVAPDGSPLTLKCGTAEFAEAQEASDLVAAADIALLALKSGVR